MKTYQYIHIVIILVFLCEPENVASMSLEEKSELRKKVLEMFHHGYRSYMDYAYPADELMPLSCKGRYRGTEPSRGDVDDTLGNFSLTLIDTLDTLVVLGEIEEFEEAVRLVINGVNFDSDIVVSVFETNIRVLGGLLGGHVMARYLRSRKKGMDWYHDELLEKAKDIGYRLLPAFNTTTGMPYPRVNLRYGVKHHLSRTGNEKDTCTACAGTMILEFSALSRLTGDPIFEEKAHRAMEYLWKSRHRASDLVGTVINIHNGDWVRRDSGVGAGIDSYYEYVLKAYILLGDETYLDRFNKHYAAIRKYVTQGPMLVDVHMHKPFTNSRNFMDALLAFWPGLLTLIGDLKPAVQTHEMLYQVIQRHSFLPEAFTTDFRIHWAQHPLRPEFLESTYFLYKATGDSHYLQVGKEVLENLNNLARVKCGFAAIKDVTTGVHEDQMDSYVLAETFKYLYLLFSEPEDLIINIDDFVFTTEAHLLPLSLSIHNNTSNGTKMPEFDSFYDENEERLYEHTCPNANHVFESNYVKTFRDPLKNMVDSSCPASQARCQVPVVRMPFVKDARTSSCRPNNHKRLKASEFVAGNKDQLEELSRMGISVVTMRDGRVQLLHTAADAASAQDAEDGMQFMQEMIELSKHQVSDAQHEPHVVQLLGPPFIGHILHAGPAQFGYDLKKNEGVKGRLTAADPFAACSSLANADVIKGRVVIVERGDCMFINKARAIQAAGAIAGIVVDNHEGTTSGTQSLFAMSGDGKDDVTIPVLFLFFEEGQKLLEALHDNEELEVFLGFKAKKPAEVLQNFVFEKASSIEMPNKKVAESSDQSEPLSHASQSGDALDEPLDDVYKVSTESGLEHDEEEQTGKPSQESFIRISTGSEGVRRIQLRLDQTRIEKGRTEALLKELISQLSEYTNFRSLENGEEYVAALRIMLEAISQNDYNLMDGATLGILQHLRDHLEPKQMSVIGDEVRDSVDEAYGLKQKLTKEMESMLDEYIVAELKKVVDEASVFSRDDDTRPPSDRPRSNWVATKVFNGHLMSYADEEELSNYGLSEPRHDGKKNFKPFLPPKVKQAPDWLSLGRGQIMLAKDGNIYADLTDSYWQLVGSDSPQGEGHSGGGGDGGGHSNGKHITASSSETDSPHRTDIQHDADSTSGSDSWQGVDTKPGMDGQAAPSRSTANDQSRAAADRGREEQHGHREPERLLGNEKDVNTKSKHDRTNSRTSNENRDEL